jgi:hypothetical protein
MYKNSKKFRWSLELKSTYDPLVSQVYQEEKNFNNEMLI